MLTWHVLPGRNDFRSGKLWMDSDVEVERMVSRGRKPRGQCVGRVFRRSEADQMSCRSEAVDGR